MNEGSKQQINQAFINYMIQRNLVNIPARSYNIAQDGKLKFLFPGIKEMQASA